MFSNCFRQHQNIRIFNGSEVWIENSVTRVTVCHLAEWRNFQFEPNNHHRFFFLHTLLSTIAFRLEYVLFYQFYAKITIFFRSRNVQFGSSLIGDVETFGKNCRENDVMTSKHKNRHTDVMHESSYTHSCKMTFPSPGRNSCPVCKNIQTGLQTTPSEPRSKNNNDPCLKTPAQLHLSHLVTKPTKWHVRPSKTQISMGVHPV